MSFMDNTVGNTSFLPFCSNGMLYESMLYKKRANAKMELFDCKNY